MEKVSLHEFTIPFKGINKKVIYHFSDSHLTEYDALSSEEEIEKAKKSTIAWEGVRKGFSDAYGEEYGDLQKQSPKTHFENLVATAADGDALVMAGDVLDYFNGANLRLFDSLMSRFEKPYIAVCGNHEPPKSTPDGYLFSAANREIQTIEFDDMRIVGIENAMRDISDNQLLVLSRLLNDQKPNLLVMHVPIMTEGNRDRLLKSGVYFQLNYEGCPENNLKFIELLKQNSSNVIAVLAGHLHYSDISEICDGLTQYVTAQGVTGNINRYIIGE